MTRARSNTPDQWAGATHAGADVYFSIAWGDGASGRPVEGRDVLVWHWHRPTTGEERWQARSCAMHTVLSTDPLTLTPSLACEDGCPAHGYIEAGAWLPV